MAQLLPSTADPGTPAAEHFVRDRLAAALPASFTVLHARRLVFPATGAAPARELEADFIVIDPSGRWLCLEVKGGKEIGCEAGRWYSVDEHDQRHDIKDPGHQAQRAAHALADYLRTVPAVAATNVPLAFGWGVVFPRAEYRKSLSPGLPKELVIDGSDMTRLDQAVACLFSRAMGNGTGNPPAPGAQRSDLHAAIVNALAPTARLAPSLGGRIAEAEHAMVRLTDEQMRILDYLAAAPRVGVRGGAGTGKTLVALERARRLSAQGARVLFLCFNRALAESLKPVAARGGVEVSTFHALCGELAKQAGVAAAVVPDDPEALRRFYDDEAPEKLMAALELLPDKRWDALVVDEAQDFREHWWIPVQQLLRDPALGSLWAFWDPGQSVFHPPALDGLGLTPATLDVNCRNTRRIAEYAYGLMDERPTLRADTPDGADVEVIACGDEAAVLEAVRRSLHHLLVDARLRTSDVIVLSPRAPAKSAVFAARRFGNIDLVEWTTEPPPNTVRFATPQRFKGLEADAVILCEVDRRHTSSSPANLYVAASRAKHVLVVAGYV